MRIGVDARNLVSNLSGIGRYVLEMCRALSAQGHSLVLYLPESPKTELPDMPGCEIRIWNFKGPWRRAIWSNTALPRAANRDRLDTFWGPAHRLPPRLAADLPVIVTIHDLVWRKAPHTMHWKTWLGERAFMTSALKRANHIVAVSHATAADIIDYRPETADRIKVIYPGITHFAPESKIPWEEEYDRGIPKRYALFVGTLEPRKNLVNLLKAFAAVSPKYTGTLKLVIAGGQGWRIGDLSALIAQQRLQSHVVLTGYVADEELARLYSDAEFLLMPSLYEGFGLPIVEAQSFGTPVITSDRSSMPEVAGNGALLVNPDKVEEIARAIVRLATDEITRAELSYAGRTNVLRFSWIAAAEALSHL